MGEGSGRESGQTFGRQSRVGSRLASKFRRVGSGPRKVTRGHLWNIVVGDRVNRMGTPMG